MDEILSQSVDAIHDGDFNLPTVTDIVNFVTCIHAIVKEGGGKRIVLVIDNASCMEELYNGLTAIMLSKLTECARVVLINEASMDEFIRKDNAACCVYFNV